ncbi:Y-family DNA polymerase [Sphingopyxis yananensis]|uniref:Y-family DNA polymerase n=1 Tax=Sphingopyxis yananensis TaxID=2886687 RepID=UPI001D101BEC|nr:DNA polymerase Y family protein [Sphingopyxis yananensis]MCC2601032.1 DNA polymerase Y family protein [Sphingopyxis yananensis]
MRTYRRTEKDGSAHVNGSPNTHAHIGMGTGARPFALVNKQGQHERLYCVNHAAEQAGLYIGMAVTQARALCRNLTLWPAAPDDDTQFLRHLRRWTQRYTPWASIDGTDGLLLDITGAAHLFGGEMMMLTDIRRRLDAMGLSCRLGLADTRGAAWALAHYHEAIAPVGETETAIEHLPVAALRLEPDMVVALQRLGLRRIADLQATARAPLARRFGPDLLAKLDQAMGFRSEPLSPDADPPYYAASMTLAEPIGLLDDLWRGLDELLSRLCVTLTNQHMGMRAMELVLRRVDKASLTLPLRLAAPMRDKDRILPLFSRQLEMVDSGFGIDQLRLRALQVEPLAMEQMGAEVVPDLNDLITRIGTRIGLNNIQRFTPHDSHWPERSFALAPATSHQGARNWGPQDWGRSPLRPTCLFPPEPIYAHHDGRREPPHEFQWRRDIFTIAKASGPERIAPEWWNSTQSLRDYWYVQTSQGRRLWIFHTPQDKGYAQGSGWFVQGEFA